MKIVVTIHCTFFIYKIASCSQVVHVLTSIKTKQMVLRADLAEATYQGT